MIRLLEITPANDDGVDSLAFRAENFQRISSIDQLEVEGCIRKDQERYFVSLTALAQLNVPRAIRILEDAEKLFQQLKIHYTRTQRETMLVDDLAWRSGVDELAAREALGYMVQGPWWGGHSGRFFSVPNAHIQPSESILRFESFSSVVDQLRTWQSTRIRDRQLTIPAALDVHTDGDVSQTPTISNMQRQRPDWVIKLPDELRELLGEIYSAMALDLRALPAMGVRALIDVVAVKLVGDAGSFEKKLALLQDDGHITAANKSILSVAIEVGNASAHRGYVPSLDDLGTLLGVVEHLLQAHYVFPQATDRLKANTPSRPIGKKRKTRPGVTSKSSPKK